MLNILWAGRIFFGSAALLAAMLYGAALHSHFNKPVVVAEMVEVPVEVAKEYARTRYAYVHTDGTITVEESRVEPAADVEYIIKVSDSPDGEQGVQLIDLYFPCWDGGVYHLTLQIPKGGYAVEHEHLPNPVFPKAPADANGTDDDF